MSQSETESARPASQFWQQVREGLSYIKETPFVRSVILVNIAWAMGGGMNNLLLDRLAGSEFKYNGADVALASLWTAAGAGLFIGMMLARRAGAWASEERRAGLLVGWALLIHGLAWAASGWMPSLWGMAALIVVSRLILGAEFGVQETLVMRVIPDDYRGRVFTTDRALELTMMTVSMVAASALLRWLTPRQMMVISGLLSASPGLVWLLAMWLKRFSVPKLALHEPQPVASD